ncbi:MAG TPA: hypothetical protein VNE40_03175 [Candidatus Dormibacteraeota bacterium]|nr:hypothetical protein [Candidatus Dormibacteraeota bacterium]
MKVIFSPESSTGFSNQAILDKLLTHLQNREVTILGFKDANQADGMIAELTDYQPEVEDNIQQISQELHKPVLALKHKFSTRPFSERMNNQPLVRLQLYSQLYIARVAIDVFLEAHLGYRVPLDGAEDRMSRRFVEEGL